MAIKEILEGNTSKVLEATELLKVLGDREGQFVWKQLTAEGGDFVAFVTADSEDSYPNKGTQDGYWYELMEEGARGIDFGTVTLSSAQSNVTISHNLGSIPSYAALLPIGSQAMGDKTHLVAEEWRIMSGGSYFSGGTGGVKPTKTKKTVVYNPSSGTKSISAGSYYWVVFA